MESNAPPLWFIVPFCIIFIGALGLICWGVLKLWRKHNRTADGALDKIIRKYELHTQAGPESFVLKFPTYVGAFVTVKETPVQVCLKKSDARKLLNELLLYNFRRGLFTSFFPYVILLTLVNYAGQKWKLRGV